MSEKSKDSSFASSIMGFVDERKMMKLTYSATFMYNVVHGTGSDPEG